MLLDFCVKCVLRIILDVYSNYIYITLLYEYILLYSADKHLGCYQFGAITNQMAMNTFVPVSLWISARVSLELIPKSETSGTLDK